MSRYAAHSADAPPNRRRWVPTEDASTPSTIEAETNAAEAQCDAPELKCDVLFRWEHSTSSEQIYCGENGDALEVIFDVRDRDGHGGNYVIPVQVDSEGSAPEAMAEEEGEE